MPCCASEIVINVRVCVASAQDTTSLFTRDMYGRGGGIARALLCEMHAKGEGKPAQRNAPPFITPCSHPVTLQRPRNPPPSPNITTSEWWYSESRVCHTSQTHNKVHSHTTAEFKFDQQIRSKRCAERRRELGGYSRHVLMGLRNILSEKVWESCWRMMRELQQLHL